MKLSIKIVIISAILLLAGACSKDLDEININPNKPTEMYPSMVFTKLSITAFGPEFYGISPYFNSWMIGGIRGGSFNWNRRGFSAEYRELAYVNEMVKEAQRTESPEYEAVAKFFRAYWIFNVTRLFGDVPYSEAAMGKEGMIYATYDDQEIIIAGILSELEEANNELSMIEGPIAGDILYNGDVTKWRKLINTFRLRILVNCSHQQQIAGQDVSSLFAAIVNDPTNNPLMEELSDSAIRYESASNSSSNYLYGNNDFITGYRMLSPVVGFMKDRQDKRLMEFADPFPKAVEEGLDPNDFNNYHGATPAPIDDENVPLSNEGKISRVNNRYYKEIVGPPHMMIGFAEQEFILAEAALRGWIETDPSLHYERGIRASFEYFGISSEEADAYLLGELIPLGGDVTDNLKKIISQKYINFFMQGGWESYFEVRRTGYPDFKQYVTPNLQTIANDGVLPKRFMYPDSELNFNSDNVNKAIQGLSEGDDINSTMWLLDGDDALKNSDPFPYH